MAWWDDSAIFAKKRKMANAKVPGERKNWNKLQLPEIYTPVILVSIGASNPVTDYFSQVLVALLLSFVSLATGDNVGALVALAVVGLIVVATAATGAAVWGPRLGAVVVGATVLTTGDAVVGANVMIGLETGEAVAGCNVGLKKGAMVGATLVFLVVGCAVVAGIMLLVLVSLVLP